MPIIWDIGTSSIMHAEVMLAERLGQELDEGVAFDETGLPRAIQSQLWPVLLLHGEGIKEPVLEWLFKCLEY